MYLYKCIDKKKVGKKLIYTIQNEQGNTFEHSKDELINLMVNKRIKVVNLMINWNKLVEVHSRYMCIHIARNKRKEPIGYTLQDLEGNSIDIEKYELKKLIRKGEISVVNLQLTISNQLREIPINNKLETLENIVSELDINSIINRAKILGGTVQWLIGGVSVYIPNDTIIIVISDTVTKAPHINNPEYKNKNIKVIGGKALKSTVQMFYGLEAKGLDLTELNTSKVTHMSEMFRYCKVPNIDISCLDTSEVKSMRQMFKNCQAKSINMSGIDISKVKTMFQMFCTCKVKNIDIAGLDISNVENTWGMFNGCDVENIDLNKFDESVKHYDKATYEWDITHNTYIKPLTSQR